MSFLDVTIVNIAFPDIRASFRDTSLAGLSWILNAYNIVFAALLVPAGRLADRARPPADVPRRRARRSSPPRPPCGLAPTVEVLVAARVVQAAGAAALVPTSLALLLPEFPLEQRATATGIWGATGAIAAAIGPSLGGVLVEAAGWRWVFFVNLAIGLPALIPARRLLHEAREAEPGPLPDVARRRPARRRGRAAVARASSRARTGAGAARASSGRSARPPSCSPCSPSARRAIRRPSSSRRCSACARSRWPTPACSPSRSGFYALLLGQRPVPHRPVALLGAEGRLRGDARARSWPRVGAPIGGRLADRFGQRVVALPGGLLFGLGGLGIAASRRRRRPAVRDGDPAVAAPHRPRRRPELLGLGQRAGRRARRRRGSPPAARSSACVAPDRRGARDRRSSSR